jgi:hypothetical protein
LAVAKKKHSKKSWFRNLLLYTCTFLFAPLLIWFLAFLLWFYWYDITGRVDREDRMPTTKTSKQMDRSTKPSDKSAQERIGEDDRRKLEGILKSKK